MLLKEYYINQYPRIGKCQQRGQVEGILLLFSQSLLLMQFLLSSSVIDTFDMRDIYLKKEISGIQLFEKQIYQSIVIYGIFCFNAALLSLFLLDILLYILRKERKSLHEIFLEDKMEGELILFQKILNKCFKGYEYIIPIPSYYTAFENLDSPIAILNLALTFLIGCFISINDFDYSFSKNRDFLSRGNYFEIYIVKNLFLITLGLIQGYFDSKITDILCIIYGVFLISSFQYLKIFNNSKTRQLDLFLNVLFTLSSILFFFQRFLNYVDILIYMLFMIIPLSFKIAQLIESDNQSLERTKLISLQEDNIGDMELISSPQIIIFLANTLLNNIKLSFSEYSLSEYSIILEQLSNYHINSCTDYPDCFCFEKVTDKQWENQIGQKKIRKFLEAYISIIFKQSRSYYLKQYKAKNSSLEFAYIHFLIEISQSRVLSLSVLSQIELINNFTLREQMYLGYLSILHKQKFQNSNVTSQDFGVALRFEEALTKIFFQYEMCLYKKLEMIHTLNNDYINLQQFLKLSKQLYSDKQTLYLDLKYMAKISQKNSLLKEMIKGYIQNLSFVEFKRDFTQRESQSQKFLIQQKLKQRNLMKAKYQQNYESRDDSHLGENKEKQQLLAQQFLQIQNQNLELEDKLGKIKLLLQKEKTFHKKQDDQFEIDQYDSNSCTVFIKFEGQELGIISKVQQSFYKIFGFENVVGSNIERIIPIQIAKYHQKLLDEYLNNICQSYNKTQSKSLLLAQNKQGWAVPIKLKYQVDYISQSDQAGIIGLIQKIETESSYLMTDCSHFKVCLSSQRLYDKLFNKCLSSHNQVYSLYLTRVMPILLLVSENYTQQAVEYQNEMKKQQYFQQHQNNESNSIIENIQPHLEEDEIIQSLAFLPLNQQKERALHQLRKPLELKELQKYISKINQHDYRIYLVKFQIHKTQNKYFKHNIIEVLKIREFKKNKELNDSVMQMKSQFKTLCNIDLKFDNQIFEKQNLSSQATTAIISKDDLTLHQSQYQTEITSHDFSRKKTKKQSNFSKEHTLKQLSLSLLEPQMNSPPKGNQNVVIRLNQVQEELDNAGIFSQTSMISPKFVPPLSSPTASQLQFLQNPISEENLIFNQQQFQLQKYFSQGTLSESPKLNNRQLKNMFDGVLKNNQTKFVNIVKQVIDKNSISLVKQESQQDSSKINSQTFDQLLSLGNSNNIISQLTQDELSKKAKVMQEQKGDAWRIQEYEVYSMPQIRRQLDYYDIEVSEGESTINYSKTIKSANRFVKDNVNSNNNDNNIKNKKSNKNQYTEQPNDLLHQITQREVAAESSIKSGQSYTNEAKKMFAQKIMSKKRNIGIQLLNLAGISSVCIILSLTISSYFQVYDLFQQEKEDFKNVAWPMQLRSTLSLEVYYLQYIRYHERNIFPHLKDQKWDDFKELNVKRIEHLQEVYYDLYKHLLLSDKSKYPYFRNVTDFQFTYILNKDEYSNLNATFEATDSLQYFFNMLYIYSRRFAFNMPHSLNGEAMINENFGRYNEPITQLQTDIENKTLSILNQIEQNVQNQMIFVIGISFFLILIVFPVYYYVQLKIENILKLFGTFTTESLQSVILTCQMTIQRVSLIKSRNPTIQKAQADANMTINNGILKKIDIQNSKKKNISVTSRIPRISFFLLFSSIIVYILVIIQPIVNNMLISTLTKESRINLELMSKFSFKVKILDIQKLFNLIQGGA